MGNRERKELIESDSRFLFEILSTHQISSESNEAVRSLERLREEVRNVPARGNVSDP